MLRYGGYLRSRLRSGSLFCNRRVHVLQPNRAAPPRPLLAAPPPPPPPSFPLRIPYRTNECAAASCFTAAPPLGVPTLAPENLNLQNTSYQAAGAGAAPRGGEGNALPRVEGREEGHHERAAAARRDDHLRRARGVSD